MLVTQGLAHGSLIPAEIFHPSLVHADLINVICIWPLEMSEGFCDSNNDINQFHEDERLFNDLSGHLSKSSLN